MFSKYKFYLIAVLIAAVFVMAIYVYRKRKQKQEAGQDEAVNQALTQKPGTNDKPMTATFNPALANNVLPSGQPQVAKSFIYN